LPIFESKLLLEGLEKQLGIDTGVLEEDAFDSVIISATFEVKKVIFQGQISEFCLFSTIFESQRAREKTQMLLKIMLEKLYSLKNDVRAIHHRPKTAKIN